MKILPENPSFAEKLSIGLLLFLLAAIIFVAVYSRIFTPVPGYIVKPLIVAFILDLVVLLPLANKSA